MLLRERSGGAHMTVAEKHSNRSITLYQATIKSLEEKLAKVRVEKEQLQRDLGVKEDELAAAIKGPDEEVLSEVATPGSTQKVRRNAVGRGKAKQKEAVMHCCSTVRQRCSERRDDIEANSLISIDCSCVRCCVLKFFVCSVTNQTETLCILIASQNCLCAAPCSAQRRVLLIE